MFQELKEYSGGENSWKKGLDMNAEWKDVQSVAKNKLVDAAGFS